MSLRCLLTKSFQEFSAEKKRRLRVGLVGCGEVSSLHMQVYSILRDRVEVVGACDLLLERAKSLADRFGIPLVFANHLDLLERCKPDFVDICTPTSSHPDITIDVARNGSHVLTEKPMARTSDDCKRMMTEAKKRGVSLCVCHNRLFTPALMMAKGIIADKAWKISSSRVTSRNSGQSNQKREWVMESKEGGLLWENGTHAVYIQRYLLGEIESVFGFSRRQYSLADDRFYILLRANSDAVGIIELVCGARTGEVYSCAIDTVAEDQIQVDLITDSLELEMANNVRRGFGVDWSVKVASDLKKFYTNRITYAAKVLSNPMRFYLRTHLGLISEFINSIDSGSPPPVGPEDGLKTIQILEALERSIREKRPVGL